MADEHTISGLMRKRAVIAGEIESLQDELRARVCAIDAVDATIRLFDPDIDLSEVRPKPLPPKHHAYKGEVMRHILDGLREANGPCDTRTLALRIMEARGLSKLDTALFKTMVKRVGAALRHYQRLGITESEAGANGMKVWSTKKATNSNI